MNMRIGWGSMSCEFFSITTNVYEIQNIILRAFERGDINLAYGFRYHYLNHYALFGGGYRSSAVNIMKRLASKYGTA